MILDIYNKHRHMTSISTTKLGIKGPEVKKRKGRHTRGTVQCIGKYNN